VDAETGGHLQISADAAGLAAYTRKFDEYADSIQRLALRNSGRYVGISTSMPVEEAIFGPLIRSRGVA
jgi:hypothetical protein